MLLKGIHYLDIFMNTMNFYWESFTEITKYLSIWIMKLKMFIMKRVYSLYTRNFECLINNWIFVLNNVFIFYIIWDDIPKYTQIGLHVKCSLLSVNKDYPIVLMLFISIQLLKTWVR